MKKAAPAKPKVTGTKAPAKTISPVKKTSPTKPTTNSGVKTTAKTTTGVKKAVGNPPAKKEETKQEVPKEEIKPVLLEQETSLTGITNAIDEIWKKGKIPVVLDSTDNFNTFLKYKGTLVDLSEHLVKKAVDQDYTDNDFFEITRKKIVYGMKAGSLLAFYFENFTNNFQDFYAPAEYFKDLNKFMTPDSFKEKEYYKKTFLKEEEDVDNMGNKGWYEADKEFKHCFVFASKTVIEDVTEKVKLPIERIVIVKIVG